jgi:alpha-glucosidase (family GH31 glycosyl hydrolase)
MRRAMRIKYSLIRYYYTEMSLVHKNGGVVFKPLYFEFIDCDGCHNDATLIYDFMIGSALKVGINSNTPDQNSTDFYFPGDITWCNMIDPKDKCFYQQNDESLSKRSKAYDSWLHLRSGFIIPW